MLWEDLEPLYIKNHWIDRIRAVNVESYVSFLNGLGWFTLMIIIVEVAHIQNTVSDKQYHRRRLGLHMIVMILAFGGAFSEMLSHMLLSGVEDSVRWMARTLQLDDWNTDFDNGDADGMGWRVLEMCNITFRSLIVWIDAFEWLCLFGILTLLFVSVEHGHNTFSTNWTRLGFGISMLCIADFATNVLRLESWMQFTIISMSLSILNRLILFPIWLIWLSVQLPLVKQNNSLLFYVEEDYDLHLNNEDTTTTLNPTTTHLAVQQRQQQQHTTTTTHGPINNTMGIPSEHHTID